MPSNRRKRQRAREKEKKALKVLNKDVESLNLEKQLGYGCVRELNDLSKRAHGSFGSNTR